MSVLALVAGSSLLTMLPGCETLTETPGENRNRMARAMDTDGKQIPDDAEKLLLLDRPVGLTDKPVPLH